MPEALELPFVTSIAGIGIRGRVDAVFRDPDGGYTLVDWKTGAPPDRERLVRGSVQLAGYRVAVARLKRVTVDRVRACFHYVGAGVTVAPADLLDEDGIVALIESATRAPDAEAGDEAWTADATPDPAAAVAMSAQSESGTGQPDVRRSGARAADS
jgi:DNA helicase-2/ATP-dependent DNA helicase PcrA